ncbi:MAG: transglutaminase-like domain-containing protein, partial [Planctomycetota bacterium]
MFKRYRRNIKGGWRKGLLWVTAAVMFVQPGILGQLIAAESNRKMHLRLREERARALRTYVDPDLPVGLQQRVVCQKQLRSCRKALGKIKAGKDAKSLMKDVEVLQDKLKVIHLNLMTELGRMGTRLFEKGTSQEIMEHLEEFSHAVDERYGEYDRLLTLVQRRRRNPEKLRENLKQVVEFLKPAAQKRNKQNSQHSSQAGLSRHAAVFGDCRPNRPPFFQWPWLLASADDIWWCVPDAIPNSDLASGTPDTNDLACDAAEISFDPNEPNDPIVAKADELDNNPVKIYEFVRNELVYEPYFGSVKGAKRTLEEMAGNDMDLASLLMALLRASGIPCRYVCGTIELSVEEAASWTGVRDPKQVVELFRKNGICLEQVDYAGGGPAAIQLDHVWVTAYIDQFPYRGSVRANDYDGLSDADAWIYLDPSFKQHTFTATQNLEASVWEEFDPDTLLNNALFGATVVDDPNEKYVSGINEDLMAEQLMVLAEPVRNYLAGKGLSTETIFRQRHVCEERYGLIPITDQYRLVGSPVNFSSLPEALQHQLTITLVNPDGSIALSIPKSLPELAGKTITLLYEPANDEHAENLTDPNVIEDPNNIPAYLILLRPRLKLGEQWLPGAGQDAPPVGMGRHQELLLEFTGPDGASEQIVHRIVAGGIHSLALDAQRITGQDLSRQYAEVCAAGQKLDANEPLMPDETIGEVLHGVGLSYFHQMDRFNQIAAGSLGLAVTRHPSMVRVGWDPNITEVYGDPNLPYEACPGGVRIDLVRDVHTAVAIDETPTESALPQEQFLFTSALTASALEYNALVQALPGKKAASAARLIQAANDREEANTAIYTVTTFAEANSL